jgi:pilus assembly protein Flp/PilA
MERDKRLQQHLSLPAESRIGLCVRYIQARWTRTERGASLVEYALLVALIAVACIVAVTQLGGATSAKFSQVGSSLGG